MKEGQCSEGKGSEEGAESGSSTRSPLGPRREGAAASSGGFAPPGPRRSVGTNSLASWPINSIAGAVLVRTAGPAAHGSGSVGFPRRSLPGPMRTPACMHGKETGLSRRGALGI